MRYHKFLRHSTYRRYGIFIATLFFSLYAIQAYVNNQNIENQIRQVESQIHELESRNNYLNNFYTKYLETEYAPYFAWHENGIIYEGEYVIKLKHRIEDDEVILPVQDEKKEAIIISTPQSSWRYFIEEKLPFLIDRGLIK